MSLTTQQRHKDQGNSSCDITITWVVYGTFMHLLAKVADKRIIGDSSCLLSHAVG